MIETAIKYGAFGLRVFPVRGKIPAIIGWQKFASRDAAEITKLFDCSFTGIGVACGELSQVTIIDIDVKNGLNGFTTLKNHGIELPATVCVNTPTGGKHFYFKYNAAVKSKVNAICDKSGIDIRNDGGLIIMPGSVHPNGGAYEFLLDQGLGEIDLAEIPADLLNILLDKEQVNFVLPDRIEDGKRNDTLFKYACQLRASGMDKSEIMPAICLVNQERCVPPYDIIKLDTIVDSACKYNKGRKPVAVGDIIYSDTYNAKVFYELMGDKIRWCRDLGGWFLYDGKHWAKDSNDNIKKYALDATEEISERLRIIGKDGKTNLRKIHTDQGINSMINCAKPLFGCDSGDFDKNSNLFNCENGTYDLNKNIFLEFNPNDLITKKANVIFDQNARADRWNNFLDEVFLGNVDLIKYVQRAIGYSMTATTKEHCMFILYGHGRNGKNIFTEAISGVMGDYALNCPSSMFVQKQNPGIPNDVARMKGCRFATANETNQNVNLDEELIKQLTGNKIITARFLNKEFFDFEATFKIFLATNHKPNIRGTDGGIWSRIQMIPFNMTVTPEKEDKNLAEKLAVEKSGIFNWMLDGYIQWDKMGLGVPAVVKEATQLYREEEDDLGQFIKNECVLDQNGFIPSQEFKERFKSTNGYYKGTKALAEYMMRNGFRSPDNRRIYYAGRQQRGFIGLRWATADDHTEDKGYSDD